MKSKFVVSCKFVCCFFLFFSLAEKPRHIMKRCLEPGVTMKPLEREGITLGPGTSLSCFCPKEKLCLRFNSEPFWSMYVIQTFIRFILLLSRCNNELRLHIWFTDSGGNRFHRSFGTDGGFQEHEV
jgi:hypothetical protein